MLEPKKQLALAFKLAGEVFYDKYDLQGEPYVFHLIAVMDQLKTEDKELKAIALLHDIIEDTPHKKYKKDITAQILYGLGFSERVVSAVVALTHLSDEDYEDYIKRLAFNEDARKVKLADLWHNSQITRIKGRLDKKHFDRIEKYHKAFVYLNY